MSRQLLRSVQEWRVLKGRSHLMLGQRDCHITDAAVTPRDDLKPSMKRNLIISDNLGLGSSGLIFVGASWLKSILATLMPGLVPALAAL